MPHDSEVDALVDKPVRPTSSDVARLAKVSQATVSYVLNNAAGQTIDLAGLLGPSDRANDPDAVLNGIAYDAAHDRLFVTGKRWPKLFEIRLVKKTAAP